MLRFLEKIDESQRLRKNEMFYASFAVRQNLVRAEISLYLSDYFLCRPPCTPVVNIWRQMSESGSSFSCGSSMRFQSSRRLAIFFPPRVRRVSRPSSLFALNAAHRRSAASFNSSIDCTGSSFKRHSNCVSTMSFAFSTCPLARGLPGMCGFVSTRNAVRAAVTGLEMFADPQSHCGLHKRDLKPYMRLAVRPSFLTKTRCGAWGASHIPCGILSCNPLALVK